MMYFLLTICLLVFLTATGASGNEINPLPVNKQSQLQVQNDEIDNIEENSFQQNMDSLFESVYSEIDTFAWNTSRVNSGRIDCSYLFDTVKIVLVDSSRNQFYVHPYIGYVTSNFGKRQTWMWHYGVDIKLNKGDTVRAAFDGIVRAVINDRYGYGRAVVIRHCWGLETIYGHLSKTNVNPYQKLRAGDVIGLGGNTGRSSGSHLHFEMRYYGEPFDPNIIIDFENFSLKMDTLRLFKDDFKYLTQLRTALYHNVRSGDNLGMIARKYGTSVSKLCYLNNITPKTILKIGRKILVRADN